MFDKVVDERDLFSVIRLHHRIYCSFYSIGNTSLICSKETSRFSFTFGDQKIVDYIQSIATLLDVTKCHVFIPQDFNT